MEQNLAKILVHITLKIQEIISSYCTFQKQISIKTELLGLKFENELFLPNDTNLTLSTCNL